MSELSCLRLMNYKKMYRSVGHYSITIFRIAISALRFFQGTFLKLSTLKKNFTLEFNFFQKSELTMSFVVESIKIRVDSTRKSSWISFYIEFNSIFEFNQIKFLLIQLQNIFFIQILKKGGILVSNFFSVYFRFFLFSLCSIIIIYWL